MTGTKWQLLLYRFDTVRLSLHFKLVLLLRLCLLFPPGAVNWCASNSVMENRGEYQAVVFRGLLSVVLKCCCSATLPL